MRAFSLRVSGRRAGLGSTRTVETDLPEAGHQAQPPATPTRWLLINLDAEHAARGARVDAWRRLRALGAHYLQPCVCLLPDRPETTRGVDQIAARARRAGARARVFPMGLLNNPDEQAVIAAFSAERSDEYEEVVSRTRAFDAEIAMESGQRRATYGQLEESDLDLKRLQRWLASIRRRDYFDAPGYADALAAITRCRHALAAFEAKAYEVEVHPTEDEIARSPWRLRVRALGGSDRR